MLDSGRDGFKKPIPAGLHVIVSIFCSAFLALFFWIFLGLTSQIPFLWSHLGSMHGGEWSVLGISLPMALVAFVLFLVTLLMDRRSKWLFVLGIYVCGLAILVILILSGFFYTTLSVGIG